MSQIAIPTKSCSLLMVLTFFFQNDMVYSEDWTWLSGDQMVDRLSKENYPGGRSGASTWYDLYTNVTWMFGGQGFSQLPSGQPHLLNDLWQFNPAVKRDLKGEDMSPYFSQALPALAPLSNGDEREATLSTPVGRQHAAMCGIQRRLVLFGGLGESNLPLGDVWVYNMSINSWGKVVTSGPLARAHAAVWCLSPFMYLFGGLGEKGQVFSDMWKLDLFSLKWTMLHGSRAYSKASGQKLLPEGRNGPSTWVVEEALYMFGGNTDPAFSYSLQLTQGLTSDLWRYIPCKFVWEPVRAELQKHREGVHSGRGGYSPTNSPGARLGASSWVDPDGGLWLFGGAGIDISPVVGNKLAQVLSDVWHFDTKKRAWAFTGGSDEGDQSGRYVQMGVTSEESLPGARTGMMVFPGGRNCTTYFLFGGVGHDARRMGGYLNDLWSINISEDLSGQYAISGQVLLLFLGVNSALLLVAMIIGLRGRCSDAGQGYKKLPVNDKESLTPGAMMKSVSSNKIIANGGLCISNELKQNEQI